MVFNWFRRKFDDDNDDQNQQNQVVEPVVTEEQTPESEATAVPPASQDLLNWAKAAYANVQQQSEIAVVAESEVSDAVETEAEPVAIEAEPVEIEAEPVTSELVAEVQVPELAVSEPETNESVVVTEITESVDTPVPFWMQSESDRLARIAALEATAIAAPEPEIKPAPRRKATIKFDDDFIWSAEVLASQGRRPEEISAEEITWLNRLRQGLDKTRLSLVNQLKSIVGQGPLNPEAVDDIEALLLQADVGVKATDQIIAKLQDKLRSEVLPPDEAIAYLKQICARC
jgi:fused signal recognition particle receptor